MESQFDIDMNEFLPLREVVFNTLRKAILTGQLKPGDRLMEAGSKPDSDSRSDS